MALSENQKLASVPREVGSTFGHASRLREVAQSLTPQVFEHRLTTFWQLEQLPGLERSQSCMKSCDKFFTRFSKIMR